MITKDDIQKLMTVFYADVRKDTLLAPVFATRIAPDDWDLGVQSNGRTYCKQLSNGLGITL